MTVKNISRSLIIAGAFLSSAYAGELKVKNNATTIVTVTVRAKENQSATNPFIITQIVQPNEEMTVTIDEKKFSGTTFSVQATMVIAPGGLILTSNECVLSGYEGTVVVKPNSDGSALVCGVTEIR